MRAQLAPTVAAMAPAAGRISAKIKQSLLSHLRVISELFHIMLIATRAGPRALRAAARTFCTTRYTRKTSYTLVLYLRSVSAGPDRQYRIL